MQINIFGGRSSQRSKKAQDLGGGAVMCPRPGSTTCFTFGNSRASCSEGFTKIAGGARVNTRHCCHLATRGRNIFFSSKSEASELQNRSNSSSHCSSVEEKLERYGSLALTDSEHLAVILGNEMLASKLIHHFGSIGALSRGSFQQLRAFLPRAKALRLIGAFDRLCQAEDCVHHSLR
jgi:hypothetical protein